MGAQKSVHAGEAKIDVNVDLTYKLCSSLLLPPRLRLAGGPLSHVISRLCVQHPNVFGGGEKLEAVWDKGICNTNFLVAIRRPSPEWHPKQSFVIQHSITPEVGVHGLPIDSFTRTASVGINLCRFSAGFDLKEPATSNWQSTTSIKLENVRPVNDEWISVTRDRDGFPITCSGNSHDSMIVLKQESQYAKANDISFSRLSFQIEQGVPLLSKLLIFNRFKFSASNGVKVGPAFLLTSLTGGSIVGDMAPYQAFSIGGPSSVRGYGDGAVGSGRSCLIANNELTIPLSKGVEGAVFMDYGSDLGSARHVPGSPALRQGKPGHGFGFGVGLRLNSHAGQFQIDYAVNALQRRTIYFGITSVPS